MLQQNFNQEKVFFNQFNVGVKAIKPKFAPLPALVDRMIERKQLMLDHLMNDRPGIFSFGIAEVNLGIGKQKIKWVGTQLNNSLWTIYFGPITKTDNEILTDGKRLQDDVIINQLVFCDWEAFQMYQY